MLKNKKALIGILYLVFFLSFLGFLAFRRSGAVSFKSLKYSVSDFINKLGSKESSSVTYLTQSVVEEESAVIGVVDAVSPAVVSIVEKTVDFDPYSGPVSQESGIGTGFIVKGNGLIVTNSHVVSDPNAEYSVVLKDGSSYDVVKINRDPVDDIAILEVDADKLPIVKLGDSSKLKVGQKAIAIGNALGQYSNTVTVGVISGVSRQVTASSGPFGGDSKTYNDVIQTDAALNPGNSGGPLLNLYGQVIGINVAVTRGAENIGFAIPVNHLTPILESYEKTGKIVRPYLGVSFTIITKDLARFRRFPEGAFISRVGSDTPAQEAGLLRGDIIVEVDGRAINEANPLDVEIQQKHKVGDRMKMRVDRGGETVILEAVLNEAPQQ